MRGRVIDRVIDRVIGRVSTTILVEVGFGFRTRARGRVICIHGGYGACIGFEPELLSDGAWLWLGFGLWLGLRLWLALRLRSGLGMVYDQD